MKLSRREFIQAAGLVAGAAALNGDFALAKEGGNTLSPAINPIYLIGSLKGWPLAELAKTGYRGLEITPASLEKRSSWSDSAQKAGLRPICVNALPDLRPYLTGSLSDAVDWRRRATIDRLLAALKVMPDEGIEFMVVAPSRLAENYQSRDQARALLVSSVKELAAAAPKVTILLLSCPFRLFDSSDQLAGLVDEIALPNVAAALDIGHAMLSDGNPAESARRLGSRLKYVQLHDADTRSGYPRLDGHLPMGAGSAKLDEVKSAIGSLPFAIGITAPSDPLGAARGALKWLG